MGALWQRPFGGALFVVVGGIGVGRGEGTCRIGEEKIVGVVEAGSIAACDVSVPYSYWGVEMGLAVVEAQGNMVKCDLRSHNCDRYGCRADCLKDENFDRG